MENDGEYQYLHIQQETKNQLLLFSEIQQIIISLINCNVGITQFDKSFITLTAKVKFRVDVEYQIPPVTM